MQPGASEAALIEQAKTDKEAFGQLYELYVERIRHYVFYRTGSAEDAEDLTAQIFIRAMQHIAHYTDQGVPFSAWLYRIAHNLVANWYRDHSRRHTMSLDDLGRWHAHDDDPALATELLEDKEVLLRAIRSLPADRQELLILKFVDQLSNAEIGHVMGRSEGAIKSLYHRCLLALKEELTDSKATETRPERRFGFLRRRRMSDE
ncbi:MAG: sigma-70 family RNA polymerase sigma factor [Chloroflexota bacterium]